MNKVTIYQFESYDRHSDGMKKSCRWGTREAIEKIVGGMIVGAGIEVDKSVVELPHTDIVGFTKKDFNPSLHSGGHR